MTFPTIHTNMPTNQPTLQPHDPQPPTRTQRAPPCLHQVRIIYVQANSSIPHLHRVRGQDDGAGALVRPHYTP